MRRFATRVNIGYVEKKYKLVLRRVCVIRDILLGYMQFTP